MISVYASRCGLDSQKDNYYDSLITAVRKLREKEIVFTSGDGQ